MSFRIHGLSPEPFVPLFALSDEALVMIGARRVFADDLRMPCRISMEHAALGEEVLLVNYEHQPANSPYRSNHAIYVRKSAHVAFYSVDDVPEVLTSRQLAVRAFDKDHMMIDAEVIDGAQAATTFEEFLANANTKYLHVHNAKRGCYAARVERA